MKKKITASVVAFALALAVPAAAFAYEPSIQGTQLGDKLSYEFSDSISMDGVEITGATDGTTVSKTDDYGQASNMVVNAVEDEYGMYKKDADGNLILDAKGNPIYTDEYARIKNAEKDYDAQCAKIMRDGASQIGSFVVNGGVEGKDATVTVYLNDYYAGQVVTYVILHEDGSIQKKTVTVNADGTVNIIVSQFSAFSFFLTEGLEGYVPVAQDGVADGALSPKTGF